MLKQIALVACVAIASACSKKTISVQETKVTAHNSKASAIEEVEISQNDKNVAVEEVVIPPLSKKAEKDVFPQSWFGNWVGELEIYNAKGLAQTIPMELVMENTDTAGVFKWYIIYGTDREKGLRPYLLRTIDAAKGHYLCDELNSIKMESYLLGNKLFCYFTVEGNSIMSIYEKEGEHMKFEIIFGKDKAVSTTGGEVVKGDTIPTVRTFPVIINQKAVLKKK